MPAPGARLSLSNLAAAGELVLSTYVTELEALGLTVPGRRYVSSGSGAQGVAWDGEQVNVALQAIHQGQPGGVDPRTQYPGAALLFAQWAVLVLRKEPIFKPNPQGRVAVPSAAALDKAAQTNLNDVAALTTIAIQVHATGTFQPVGVGQAIDEVVPMGPEAGLVGARLMFSVNLG